MIDHFYRSVLTSNPKAFSNSGGTYLRSLFRDTQSRSFGELAYSEGDSLSSATTFSNEVSEALGATIAAGFVKCGFPRLTIGLLTTKISSFAIGSQVTSRPRLTGVPSSAETLSWASGACECQQRSNLLRIGRA